MEDKLNPGVGADVVTAFVVDEVLNGVLDPDDDKDRPKPSPGLLVASGIGFTVVCVGNESDALPPPNARPPEVEEEPKPNPDPVLVVTGLVMAEIPVDESEDSAGFEMEDGAPKEVGAAANPLLTCLSSPAGEIDS